jgi:hypothetical protein
MVQAAVTDDTPHAGTLRLLLWAALTVWAAAWVGLTLKYLYAPGAELRVANAGTTDEYVVGTVRHFRPAGRDLLTTTHFTEDVAVPGWPLYQGYACGNRSPGFFVVRRANGFIALSDQSTYWRRSPVELAPPGWRGYDEARLVDMCGDGHFSADDGQILFGPAPRPLDALPLRIIDGRVFVTVDPRERQRRDIGRPASPVAA